MAGDEHSLVLDVNGHVYSFERENQRQTGQDNTDDLLIPQKISTLSNIIAISAAGASYSLAVDGQLGLGSEENQLLPKKSLRDIKISIPDSVSALDISIVPTIYLLLQ